MTWRRITSVSVTGGFLDGAKFDLCDGLNCFIGARGTGKTTVLELVRYALNALPSREDQILERRRLESLIERNLGGGRIDVAVETEQGLSYVVSRSTQEDPLIKKDDGRIVEWDTGAGSFFRADIFSQNEVESIADRATSQLTLLDNFETQSIASVEARLKETYLALKANENRMVPLKERIGELSEDLATLPCVKEKIGALVETQGENAEAINLAHTHKSLRDREARLLTSASGSLSQVQRSACELQGRVTRDWSRLSDQDVANGPNRLLAEEAADAVDRCGSEIDELVRLCDEAVATAIRQVADVTQRLKVVHAWQETEFHDLIAKHEHAQSQATERARWERRGNELLQKDRERHQLMDQLDTVRCERTKLLERLSELRDERFSIRQRISNRINDALSPTIRVSVVQFGDTDDYLGLLESNLSLAKVKHHIVAKKLANNLCPSDLADAVSRRDKNALMERGELNVEQADTRCATIDSASGERAASMSAKTIRSNEGQLPRLFFKTSRSAKTSNGFLFVV
jgi:DNA repair exonuclease SbcCD ATPase subunit